jgi:hypothetical protein
MKKARKGQIALAMLTYLVQIRGVKNFNKSEVTRTLGQVAKATDIPLDELKQFARELIEGLVDKVLA